MAFATFLLTCHSGPNNDNVVLFLVHSGLRQGWTGKHICDHVPGGAQQPKFSTTAATNIVFSPAKGK